MTPPPYDLIVLRHGELFLKGDNRAHFEALLERNVRRCLATQPAVRLQRGQGRLFLEGLPAGEVQPLTEKMRRVFGLSSVSPAISTSKDLDSLSQAALALMRWQMSIQPPRSFRIKARRSDKQFPLPSPEIGRLIGARVVQEMALAVDLTRPEVTIGVEVGPRRCFAYIEQLSGAGGLPVGASGHVALLLSGGIDSPVAGYLMQKRGCTLRAIYFHSPPYTGARAQAKVEQLAQRLAPAQGELELHVVRFTAIQEAIRSHAPQEMLVILYRRAMMRIASALARKHDCLALVTGENLGQVASQTLANLSTIEHAASLPVLRPLLTYDKAETTVLAQRIDTYALSIEPYPDCCALFVPRHPLTRSRPEAIARVEERLALADLLETTIAETELVRLEM